MIRAVSHTVTRRTRVPIEHLFDTVVAEGATGGDLPGPGEVLLSERPTSFSSRITTLRGAPGTLAAEVVSWWSFEPDGAGSRLAWTYTFEPRSRLTRGPLRAYVRLRGARGMNRDVDRCIALALSRLS